MNKENLERYKNDKEAGSGKCLVYMKGIDKWFGHVHALHNIDFSIYENEIVALVGDNGAGKNRKTAGDGGDTGYRLRYQQGIFTQGF